MKVKASKAGVIVSIVFTALFAIGAIVFLIMDMTTTDEDYIVFFFAMAILALCCLIATIATAFSVKRQNKRYAMIAANLEQMDCHAQFIIGQYGEKGAAGKAAAKTAASALGGALMAVFFGFGAWRVYGANNQAEFVLTDGGLFVGRPDRTGFDFANMAFIENGSLPATLKVKKNSVIMKASNGDNFNFNTKMSGIETEQLVQRLNNFLNPAPKAQPVAESGVNENTNEQESAKQLPPDDPFAD